MSSEVNPAKYQWEPFQCGSEECDLSHYRYYNTETDQIMGGVDVLPDGTAVCRVLGEIVAEYRSREAAITALVKLVEEEDAGKGKTAVAAALDELEKELPGARKKVVSLLESAGGI